MGAGERDVGEDEMKRQVDGVFERFGEREVRICDMDAAKNQLIDECGRRYEEVETNIWGPLSPKGARRILYLGTGRHGGGIILRALYAKTDAGEWLNSATGERAPFPAERQAAW